MKYLGIDPGKSGSLVVIDEKGELIDMIKMPEDPTDLLDFFEKHKDLHYAVLEKVWGRPGMGGASMFTFGENFGYLVMALLSKGIRFELATPQKWMKEFQLGSKKFGESKTQWKNRLKAKANQLFPKVKVLLWNSDALLIAEYCRRKF